jgi:hypothetical protein
MDSSGMLQHSRKPAALVLLTVLGAAAALLLANIGPVRDTGESLDDLEVKIAQPDATPETWRIYAQRLQGIPRYTQAAAAFRHLLLFDPYDQQAKVQCATCLALAGNPDEYLGFMREVVLTDPKLAVNILRGPESQRYAADPRYAKIATDAQMQSMD